MEARFGHDFGAVKVHTGADAERGAAAVDAAAYTVGTDVVFGAGRYAPETAPGFRLLAHELAHVVQNGGHPTSVSAQPLELGKTDDPLEREADAAATDALVGTRARPSLGRASALRLRRAPSFSPDCKAWHRCIITAAIDAAKPFVDTVIKELTPLADGTVTTGRVVDVFRVHFHTFNAADATKVLERFRLIRGELDAPIRYLCFEQSPEICKGRGGFVGAFTDCMTPGADVGLCAPFYLIGCAQRVHDIVHELVHHFVDLCSDPAYADRPEYISLPREVSLENADSYAQFADMVVIKQPTCKNCN